MAAQYDVNLENCALLKCAEVCVCVCGEWKLNSTLAAGQAPVRSLALKIS